MLTNLDKKLIEQESHRFDTKKVKRWLKCLEECPITYDELFEKYNLHEFTIHWYDSGPRFSNISCDLCDDKNCNKCSIWKEWDGSKKQLTYNTWIDVEGPGIWGMSQKECNNLVKKRIDRILKDEDFDLRFYYYQPPDENYINFFWYNRDRERFDYWFIFERKNK